MYDYVTYNGEHSVTFSNASNEIRNTWTDWGLVPSSRHSEPIEELWSQTATVGGVNGQEDLVRLSPFFAVNSYSRLRESIRNDNRDYIKTNLGYDIYKPMTGNLSFIIADQETSFFVKTQEIVNFLDNKIMRMAFNDDPSNEYTVRTTVENVNNSTKFSSIEIGYSVISV